MENDIVISPFKLYRFLILSGVVIESFFIAKKNEGGNLMLNAMFHFIGVMSTICCIENYLTKTEAYVSFERN